MGNLLQNLNPVYIKKIYLKIWRLRDERDSSEKNNIPDDKIYHASTILSEINMNDISFFSAQRFLEGQSIVIEFQIPQKFTVNAEVEYCRSYSMKSQVISKKKLPYRGRSRFTFAHPEEKNILRKFVSSIEPPDTNKKKIVFKAETDTLTKRSKELHQKAS